MFLQANLLGVWKDTEKSILGDVCACMLSLFSCVQLFMTLWTGAHQTPLLMVFSRHKYRSRLPCPPPGDLPDPVIEPVSLPSPALAGGFFTTSITWEDCKRWTLTLKS